MDINPTTWGARAVHCYDAGWQLSVPDSLCGAAVLARESTGSLGKGTSLGSIFVLFKWRRKMLMSSCQSWELEDTEDTLAGSCRNKHSENCNSLCLDMYKMGVCSWILCSQNYSGVRLPAFNWASASVFPCAAAAFARSGGSPFPNLDRWCVLSATLKFALISILEPVQTVRRNKCLLVMIVSLNIVTGGIASLIGKS